MEKSILTVPSGLTNENQRLTSQKLKTLLVIFIVRVNPDKTL
jgi:hypothetical protein